MTAYILSKLELEMEQIKERNEIRLLEAKQNLGSKYLLHESNMVKRKFKRKKK